MSITVVDKRKTAMADMAELFTEAMATAEDRGFDKAVICLAYSDGKDHRSMVLRTNNLRTTDIVAIMEICKFDVIAETHN